MTTQRAEYQPDALRIDADFFEQLIDPDGILDTRIGTTSEWRAEQLAALAATLVSDAFWAATNSSHDHYIETFVRELANAIRENDGWWIFVKIADDVVRGETWTGETGQERCPACGRRKKDVHQDWCCMQKRLPCDLDAKYLTPPDHSQSPSYAGGEAHRG
jgi:hypothetical protein